MVREGGKAMNLFNVGNIQVSVMSMAMSGKQPFKFNKKTKVFKFLDAARIQVSSQRLFEVEIDGKIKDADTYLIFYVDRGQTVGLREVKGPKLKLEADKINKARSSVTETVLHQEEYDGGAFQFHGKLDAVIRSLEAIRKKAPEKYRKTARCKIESTGDYEGSHYATIEVTYRRPETDKEVIERLRQAATAKMLCEREERQRLETLKAKYAEVP